MNNVAPSAESSEAVVAEKKRPCLSIVVPCFNESATIDELIERLEQTLSKLPDYDYEIICIDDGSTDSTLVSLCNLASVKPQVIVLELSRNFGKEAALTAGIDAARGEAVIPIDGDLQHPPELILEMVEQWEAGSDVVLARRRSRETDHPLQRQMTGWFYRGLNLISDSEIPRDIGDFRLMDKLVVNAVKSLPERRRFMKGLFAWVGFRQSYVEFDVEPRAGGSSSFSAFRLWRLAIEGITSFSTLPLVIWSYIGFTVAALSMIYGFWIVLKTLLFGIDIPGYASLLTAVLFLGGIQLMGIGVLGEYVGRIYSESKQRPIYIVRQRHDQKD